MILHQLLPRRFLAALVALHFTLVINYELSGSLVVSNLLSFEALASLFILKDDHLHKSNDGFAADLKSPFHFTTVPLLPQILPIFWRSSCTILLPIRSGVLGGNLLIARCRRLPEMARTHFEGISRGRLNINTLCCACFSSAGVEGEVKMRMFWS